MQNGKPALCFIGFGEAGQAIAAGLAATPASSSGCRHGTFCSRRREGAKLGRRPPTRSACASASSAADAVRDADIVIAAVTAASSVEAAKSVKAHLAAQAVLPRHQFGVARPQAGDRKLLGDAARYVDVAVLAPIYPARHQTPMLLAGPHAQAIAPVLAALGMRASIAGPETGARRGDQDGAQRHDQGHRGADARMLSRRRPRWRDRRSRGLDEEQLSRSRLGEGRALQSRAHGEPRRAASRRNGRSCRHVARARRRAADGDVRPSNGSAKWARSASSKRCAACSTRTARRCLTPSAPRRATGTEFICPHLSIHAHHCRERTRRPGGRRRRRCACAS